MEAELREAREALALFVGGPRTVERHEKILLVKVPVSLAELNRARGVLEKGDTAP